MKHMSKHTMVEHVLSHHSPQHRTESPTIPIRISLIWDPPRLQSEMSVSCDFCAPLMDIEPLNRFQKCARLYKYLVKRCSFNEYILLFFHADQIVLSGTSKDDFSALSGLEMIGLKMSFSMWLHRKKKSIAPGSYMESLFKLLLL